MRFSCAIVILSLGIQVDAAAQRTKVLDLAENLETWMTDLPPELRELPLIQLALPGSHDSFTYNISASSGMAPDSDPILQELVDLGGDFAKEIIARWSLTQRSDVTIQLSNGIRYFDLRLAKNEEDGLFYYVHNMFSEESTTVLQQINAFLDRNPKEVVFLDCQHFHAFLDSDHTRFSQTLISIFGQKLQPFVSNMTSLTLEVMTDINFHQVILVYRERDNLEDVFWPSYTLPNPWANTMDVPYLIEYLTENLPRRNYSFAYVSQMVLTPDTDTIVANLLSNLEEQCFLPLEEEKYKWIANQTAGPQGVNIIMSDFIDYNDYEHSKAVVNLNQNLLTLV